jgi:hypothetical protein
MRHELLGKRWLLAERAHNTGLAQSHYCTIRHCHRRCQAQGLAIQTALAEKVSLSMNSDNRVLPQIGTDGDLDLAFPDVKDGIRRLALREDSVIFPVVRYAPAAVHGGEEFVDAEGTFLGCFHREVLPYRDGR